MATNLVDESLVIVVSVFLTQIISHRQKNADVKVL